MAPPATYADTTALIGLARIDRLDLLAILPGPTRATVRVWDEATGDPAKPGVAALLRARAEGLLVVVAEGDPAAFPDLDPGECTVLTAAAAAGGIALVDERKARARIDADPRLKGSIVQTTGVAGLILLAKRRGYVPSVRPLLDALIGQGFWMNPTFYQEVLRQAHEPSGTRRPGPAGDPCGRRRRPPGRRAAAPYPTAVGARKSIGSVGRSARHHGTTMTEFLALLVAVSLAVVRSRADLVAENLLLRQQLAVLSRPTRKRSRLRARDRLFWILARLVRSDWRRHLVLVRPETVVGWHRRGWKLFWRWKSCAPFGRPRLSPEVRELIARMAAQNPRWGSERIRGELLKLGIVVSQRSVQHDRRRGPTRPPNQSRRTFLRNHRPTLWAADVLTVQTLTFGTLHLLVFLSHARRELVHPNVTASPTAAWIWRQLIQATPWGRAPR